MYMKLNLDEYETGYERIRKEGESSPTSGAFRGTFPTDFNSE